MNRRTSAAATLTLAACGMFASICMHGLGGTNGRRATLNVNATAVTRIALHATRQADSDLEISGMVGGLSPDTPAYVRYADVMALPQVTVAVRGDENFPDERDETRVTGVPLEELARALAVSTTSDLMDAWCTDKYRTHYPASYIAAHHPVLGLKVDGLDPDVWAQRRHQRTAGRYFITHASYKPAFTVLRHADEPQVPTGVVHLHFSTTTATYGAISPANHSAGMVDDGFVIARQNCLRCHNQGAYGGTKAGVPWDLLSMLARQQTSFFENYVHDPRSVSAKAQMPANPEYDDATLHALTAYFRTISDPPSRLESRGDHE